MWIRQKQKAGTEGRKEGRKKGMKKGVLVVSFGSTYQDTREKNIDALVETFRSSYPEAVFYQAFSSNVIRKILRDRDAVRIPDIEEGLRQMKAEGITHAYVQPTHILDGIENNRMKEIVRGFREEFQVFRTGSPLLDGEEDFEDTAKSIWKELGPLVKEDILVLMGHGTPHEANSAYDKLEGYFRRGGNKNIYISTVEGVPLIEDIMKKMRAEHPRSQEGENTGTRVVLAPFMLVAGDHARNDMAGDGDSYAAKLKAAGYRTECILKGIGEYEGIRKIYVRHLDMIMQEK